ncbi:MAG TPA: glycosyltransferase [Verrucomicrobiae bacterium]|nr:glycosyltransferase [Verrucomicrobiae bacterium]
MGRTKGGIQVFSGFFLRALMASLGGGRLRLLCKNDRADSLGGALPNGVGAVCAGDWPGVTRTVAFVGQIVPAALRDRPDLIICGHMNFALAAHWVHRWRGIPYWIIAHGIEAWNLRRPGMREAVRGSQRILAVSRFTRDRLVEQLDLPPDRLSLLPNTFDEGGLTPGPKPEYLLRRYGISARQPVILTVARLSSPERYKGYDKIIEAMPSILERVPQVHYLLVGKGDDRGRVERRVRDMGLEDHVSLAGFVPESELCDHYNLCDVFAMPSKGEGFGIVFLEALACGKPVVAGNLDGSRDALCDGELGALIDPDDVGQIAKTLAEILLGEYRHALIHRPQALRDAVVAKYGYARFEAQLREHLGQLNAHG